MSKTWYAILGIVIIVGLIMWWMSEQDDDGDVAGNNQTQQTETEAEDEGDDTNDTTVTVVLAEQNNSDQPGSAVLTEVDGKTVVTLMTLGVLSSTPQPAHIHMGACPTPDSIKYNLTSLTNGKSVTTLDVPMKTVLSQLPLAINVHKSAAEVSVYTACGNIQP